MQEFYTLASFFLIYAFFGWALEVAYHVVTVGKFINRGFLNGPICPIYGMGMISVITILGPLQGNLPVLFFGGLIFATSIELVGGFVLYKLFHMRWWDYSNEPFNLKGYVCPKFSLAWGVCIVLVMDVIHPMVDKVVTISMGWITLSIVCFLFLLLVTDIVITVLTVLKLNKDLRSLNMIAENIHKISDELTEKIGETTMKAQTTVQEGQLQAALAKSEFKDDLDKFKKNAKGLFGYGRLYKAFPGLKHDLYNDELKELIHNIKNKAHDILT